MSEVKIHFQMEPSYLNKTHISNRIGNNHNYKTVTFLYSLFNLSRFAFFKSSWVFVDNFAVTTAKEKKFNSLKKNYVNLFLGGEGGFGLLRLNQYDQK